MTRSACGRCADADQPSVPGTRKAAFGVVFRGGSKVARGCRTLLTAAGVQSTFRRHVRALSSQLLEFVVMATPEDMRANPEYIRRADKIVEVPGGPNRNNYANVDLICKIASQEKV